MAKTKEAEPALVTVRMVSGVPGYPAWPWRVGDSIGLSQTYRLTAEGTEMTEEDALVLLAADSPLLEGRVFEIVGDGPAPPQAVTEPAGDHASKESTTDPAKTSAVGGTNAGAGNLAFAGAKPPPAN